MTADKGSRSVSSAARKRADAHVREGMTLLRQGRREEAAAQFKQALQCQPNHVEAAKSLGDILCAQGRGGEAIPYYQEVLKYNPRYATVHYNLGIALHQQGRLDDAAANYERALAIEPRNSDAWTNLGQILKTRGQLDRALAALQRAVQLRPDLAEHHCNIAGVYSAREEWERAETSLKEALRLDPQRPEFHNVLGYVLNRQNKFDEAIKSFYRAIELDPQFADAYGHLGIVWDHLGYLDHAMACYDQALRLNPNAANFHFCRGVVLLRRGDYERGWAEVEWRWSPAGMIQPQFNQPRWDGSALSDRTILLCAEQGLGDTIQFLRYAPLVKERGGKVLLQCQPALASLAATCPGIDAVFSGEALLPHFDVYAPLLALPCVFGTTPATIPARIPYLTAEPARANEWRRELAHEPKLKVGIVWQGNPQYKSDSERSVPLREFAPLAEVPGVALLSLQFGKGSEQLATTGLPITDLGSRAVPLDNLAAVLVNLDFLITVDTAPGHLAGALGVPFWLALSRCPHWPWMLDRTDSPWYPTARLFRQREPGNWRTVFTEMAQALWQMQKGTQ